jgi:integrase
LADYVYPIIGDRTVDAIGLDDVKRVLEPIWRTKPETARRVRGRIEAILDLAITSGARKAANPASVRLVRQMLGKGKRRVKHHAAYPWQTLPAWLEPIAERTDVAARALVFLILTAARSSEARKARWVEIDTHRRLWILPHDRMKMEAPHTVPLSRQALAIVEAMRPLKISPYVFPGRAGNPISDSSLRNILREYGVTKDVGTLHGMRSAFRDWAAESGVPEPVAEAALSHQIGDATVAAYRRTRHLEERREVMQKWADFVL